MRRLSRNTPAVAIAVVAVVAASVAVAETATGGGAAVTPAQVKKLAAAEVKRLAPTLAVKSAQTATSATSANGLAMFAQVTASGSVTTNSQGVAQGNVVRTAPGFYCFSGLANAPKGGVAILDTNVSGGGSGVDLAQIGIGTLSTKWGSCPAGTQAHVLTFNPGTSFADDPFFVVFWS